jgi:hypothetical protein
MTSSTARDEAISQSTRENGSMLIWIIGALAIVLTIAGVAYYGVTHGFGGSAASNAANANKARSYRTIALTEVRAEPNQAAKIVVSLREGTTVSGVPAGDQDGIEWLEITAVDGTKGFVPKTLLKELGPSTASTEIRGGVRRIITSTTVNLRETPSLSGKILGVADGGARLVADGSIQSEGEDWLRVPIDGQTTVFIMQRFTTADDDAGGDGIEGNAQATIGVRGFATAIANVQATPLPDSRIVRALQIDEEVRIIGQTNAGRSWYVLRLADGSQGFAPREAIRIDPNASRWVYPDGTEAPGPNIPKGASAPLTAEQLAASQVARQRARARAAERKTKQSGGGEPTPDQAGADNTVSQAPDPSAQPSPTPEPTQPSEPTPVPGPQ